MQQPVPTIEPFPRAAELQEHLGVESALPVELYDNGVRHTFVAFESADAVAAVRPEAGRLLDLGIDGLVCFAPRDGGWKARVFVPSAGVGEDPATGSAAGPLALHLARHGRIAFGDEIEITQGVEIGRPSTLYACAHSPERIDVGGSAVIVARGEFRL